LLSEAPTTHGVVARYAEILIQSYFFLLAPLVKRFYKYREPKMCVASALSKLTVLTLRWKQIKTLEFGVALQKKSAARCVAMPRPALVQQKSRQTV
jgi:hypothetical protein